MNTVKHLIAFILITCVSISHGQDKDDEKHENHYKQLAAYETDLFKIEFSDAHSQKSFTIVKVKISNKSNDYLEIDPSKIKFKYDFGSFSPKVNTFLIEPKKSKSKTFKISGDNNFHVDKLELFLSGFSIIPTKGNKIDVDQFQLPASTNNIDVNGLQCTLSKLSQETKETSAKFNCKNETGSFLIVNPSKLAVNSEKTSPYANDAGRAKKIA